MKTFNAIVAAGLLLCSFALFAGPQKQKEPGLQPPASRDRSHTNMLLADEVRHQLVTLPYYDVFDWLEAEVRPDAIVVLRGQVTRPTTKSDAEKRVRALESVANVVNEIEVLPLSQSDDQIRVATYRAIYKFDSPLFQYAVRSVPPIHIIVKNGRVTLKGVVAREMDRQLVYTTARSVPGVFEVKDELQVEK